MRIKVSNAEQIFSIKIHLGLNPDGELAPVLSEKRVQQRAALISDPKERDRFLEGQSLYRESLTGIEEITAKFVSWGWYTKTQIQSSSIKENPFAGPFTSQRDNAFYAREKFRRLFRGWDLELEDDAGEPLKLEFDVDGSLTESSMVHIDGSPQLLRVMEFIVAELDRILEYGESPEGSDVLGGDQEKNLSTSSEPGSDLEERERPE